MNKNFKNQPAKIIALTVIFLFVLTFLPKELTVFGIQLKHIDIISSLKENELENYYEGIDEEFETDNSDDSDSTDTVRFEKNKDNNLIEASVFNLPNVFNLETYRKKEVIFRNLPIAGNVSQMKYFYNSLKNSNSQKIRVAHFGDSIIEGDNITSEIRRILQKKFGGNGIGFLSIVSEDARFRPTIRHKFSDDWKKYSVYTSNPQNFDVGISGEVFIPKKNSWVEYYSTGVYSSIRNFNTIRLFYAPTNNSKVKYSLNGSEEKSLKLNGSNTINEEIVKTRRAIREIKLNFDGKSDSKLFGVSLEKGNGIYVDNFPLRGNSGVSLMNISDKQLQRASELFNYKLIILQFGLNIATSSKSNLTWYKNEFIKVVKKFQKHFPNTSFLLVSVSDKSMRRGRKFITNPNVISLVKIQKEIAKKTGIAFWNLFEAMGGRNSMAKWVKANPQLATSDYTHFTFRGSKKIGELIAKTLLDDYK